MNSKVILLLLIVGVLVAEHTTEGRRYYRRRLWWRRRRLHYRYRYGDQGVCVCLTFYGAYNCYGLVCQVLRFIIVIVSV